MNVYLSLKLKHLSFILMVMVVFLHAYNPIVKLGSGSVFLGKGYSLFIQDFVCKGFTRISVPMFFLISGYLYFLRATGKFGETVLKYNKRFKTIVIPYILWSFFGLVFYLLLQQIPYAKVFFTKKLIIDYSIIEVFKVIFINPIPYQLWFLRDLIVLIFFSPLIFGVIKNIKWYLYLMILLIAWVLNWNFVIVSCEALLFFFIGAYITLCKPSIVTLKLSRKKICFFLVLWLAMVFIETFIRFYDLGDDLVLNHIHKGGILIGCIAFWTCYDLHIFKLSKTKYNLDAISKFSFFLYCIHEPMLTILTKAAFYLCGSGEVSSIILFIIIPLLTVATGVVSGYYVKLFTPRFYAVMTGDR